MSNLTAGAGERAAPWDEGLMEAYARCGDSTAFEQLYDRWSDRLFGYIARAVDPATAEELFQTLWMRLHAARQSYGSGRAVAPWIFAIAANLRREEWRRRGRRPEEPQAAPTPSGTVASAAEEALAVEPCPPGRTALAT